jgi:subtilisin family serine protease
MRKNPNNPHLTESDSFRVKVSKFSLLSCVSRAATWNCIVSSMVVLFVIAQAAQPRFEIPREPDVKPNVPSLGKDDENGNLIDDKIDKEIQDANAVLSDSTASAEARAQAKARLVEGINVILFFNRQITKEELEKFVALGGQVEIIFRTVTYGWSGTIARGQIPSFVTSMGPGFVGIRKPKPIRPLMHSASRLSRVRNLWLFGYDGDIDITIAILDTGISGTHADLAGREMYWYDNVHQRTEPDDYPGHGSLVAGIALGSGLAGGIAPATIQYEDSDFLRTITRFSRLSGCQ